MKREFLGILVIYLIHCILISAEPNELKLNIVEVELGIIRDGVFIPLPERIIPVNEVFATRIAVTVVGPLNTNYNISLTIEIVHPLGFTVVKSEKTEESILIRGADRWGFSFDYKLDKSLPTGYYTLKVTANAGASTKTMSKLFFIQGYTSLENFIELTYTLELKGRGFVRTLTLALPSDPSFRATIGPLISPKPEKIVHDSFGNAYAFFENLSIENDTLKINVWLAGSQRLTIVDTDAPLISPIPVDVTRFLEPSTYIESNHPDIVALAMKLTNGVSTFKEALSRIADYVSTNVKYSEEISSLPGFEKLGALWTLHARKGICLHISRLYVALARAAGIPARVVEGFSIEPPGLNESRVLHAYVEAYIPGYGWILIEPQKPGTYIRVIPPSPGYLLLVRGKDEEVSYEGPAKRALTYAIEYVGEISASFSYTASIRSITLLGGKLDLHISSPSYAFFNDQLNLPIVTTPLGAVCEVLVRSPSGFTYYVNECRIFQIALNETGNWLIDVFASMDGYLPSFSRVYLEVKPKPINLSLDIVDARVLRSPRVIVKTHPSSAGVGIKVSAKTCYGSMSTIVLTGLEGTGEVKLEPLLLPCELIIEASIISEGYQQATQVKRLWVLPSPELIACITTAVLATMIYFRLKKREHSFKS
ncbi:MAG: transglutaminase domain-containing protein [Thermofilaceae archaeon]